MEIIIQFCFVLYLANAYPRHPKITHKHVQSEQNFVQPNSWAIWFAFKIKHLLLNSVQSNITEPIYIMNMTKRIHNEFFWKIKSI